MRTVAEGYTGEQIQAVSEFFHGTHPGEWNEVHLLSHYPELAVIRDKEKEDEEEEELQR